LVQFSTSFALTATCCGAGTSPFGRSGPAAPPPKEQFFYQAADGQAAFLAALPARMLAASAGDGGMPDAQRRVVARVVDLERVTQTAATRRRLGPLSHVPLGGATLSAVLQTPLAAVYAGAPLQQWSSAIR
jgi:hypothetical protein